MIPAYYRADNVGNSLVTPSTVHIQGTDISRFFRRYLLQKAMSVFKWELPDHWDRDYFLYTLYVRGYVGIINTNKFGVIPQGCTLKGYDVFYRPASILVTNPLLQGLKELQIGSQCTLFKLEPDYGGIMDLVSFYGDTMALTAQTAGINILNSKLSYVFSVDNKSAAESFKKMYDNLSSGNPMVIYDKKLMSSDGTKPVKAWEAFEQDVGKNYIADRLLLDLKKWEDLFDTDVGIPNANTEKKERLVVDEVLANNVETATKCEMWLESLKNVSLETNNMFGTNISVRWRNDPLVVPSQNVGGVTNADVDSSAV